MAKKALELRRIESAQGCFEPLWAFWVACAGVMRAASGVGDKGGWQSRSRLGFAPYLASHSSTCTDFTTQAPERLVGSGTPGFRQVCMFCEWVVKNTPT